MKEKLRVAICQMETVPDKGENLKKAQEMLAEAGLLRADIAVLPEMFNCPYDIRFFAGAAEGEAGESCRMLAEEAAFHNMVVVGGTIPERDGDRLYNTCFVYDGQGQRLARYRKHHLFDIDIPGQVSFRESRVLSSGMGDRFFMAGGRRFGLAICYDIRFPEFIQQLSMGGAEAIVIPGAFNHVTGPAHWELLARTRAVDNQSYVLMAAPARSRNKGGYQSHGHSMIADPWGTVVATAGEDEAVVVEELDFSLVEKVRRELPLLSGRTKDDPVL